MNFPIDRLPQCGVLLLGKISDLLIIPHRSVLHSSMIKIGLSRLRMIRQPFCGGWIEAIAEIGCTAVGLDWTIDIGDARQRIGDQVALQGNLDPAVMLASPATIEIEAKRVLDAYGPGNGHVFNLGHGITPAVPPEHVQQLIDTVHSYSRRYHEPTD